MRIERMLVPLDGSALAECVLPRVIELARRHARPRRPAADGGARSARGRRRPGVRAVPGRGRPAARSRGAGARPGVRLAWQSSRGDSHTGEAAQERSHRHDHARARRRAPAGARERGGGGLAPSPDPGARDPATGSATRSIGRAGVPACPRLLRPVPDRPGLPARHARRPDQAPGPGARSAWEGDISESEGRDGDGSADACVQRREGCRPYHSARQTADGNGRLEAATQWEPNWLKRLLTGAWVRILHLGLRRRSPGIGTHAVAGPGRWDPPEEMRGASHAHNGERGG
jgi:hypothetical protein